MAKLEAMPFLQCSTNTCVSLCCEFIVDNESLNLQDMGPFLNVMSYGTEPFKKLQIRLVSFYPSPFSFSLCTAGTISINSLPY